MSLPQVNADLPSSYMIPGVFIALDLNGSGAGLNQPGKRVLLVGHKTSAGTAAQDVPVQVTSQSDANTYAGRGSDLARMFAAAQSQSAGSVDLFILPIAEPVGGTQMTRQIQFGGTAAAQAGSVDVTIAGVLTSVRIAAGDSPVAIAANLAHAINLNVDLPVTALAASGTVTLAYRHASQRHDLPMIVNTTSATTITASPGSVTLSGTASGAGAMTITVGGTTFSAAVAASDTAATVAANMVAAISATGGPVKAALTATSTVTLYFATDRVVNRLDAAFVATTGVTLSIDFGTAGTGSPVLTTALTNVAALPAFQEWATGWSDVNTLGLFAQHIEAYADGRSQKDQRLHAASTRSLAVAGQVPDGVPAVGPSLSSSPRYSYAWCQDAPQQEYELAARLAVICAAEDFTPNNYDGTALVSQTATVPLMLPHVAVRPSDDAVNAALRSYYLTPLTVSAGGQLVVLRGRTTSKASDARLWEWGTIRTLDYYRRDLNAFLRGRFKNKSIRTSGAPRTSKTITTDSIRDAVIERLKSWDNVDLFDGADALKAQVSVAVNAMVPTRIDTFVPCRPPMPLHQIGVVGGLV